MGINKCFTFSVSSYDIFASGMILKLTNIENILICTDWLHGQKHRNRVSNFNAQRSLSVRTGAAEAAKPSVIPLWLAHWAVDMCNPGSIAVDAIFRAAKTIGNV